MAFHEIESVLTAQGLRCNAAAQTVSGVRQGVALLADIAAGTLLLSVNVSEKLLPKLETALAAYAPVTVAAQNGVLITCAAIRTMDGTALLAFLDTAVAQSVALISRSFDDRFEKDGEPFSAYLRGILGALVGALVGVLPWFLVEVFLDWSFWYLGVLVGIASFFGYRYLWGAHSTRFAWTCIIVCSLLAMLLSQAASTVLSVMELLETVNTVGEAVAYIMETAGIGGFFQSGLFGIIACAVGLFGMKRQILVYTHESNYLRRGRKKK